jgi:hypothetical protein
MKSPPLRWGVHGPRTKAHFAANWGKMSPWTRPSLGSYLPQRFLQNMNSPLSCIILVRIIIVSLQTNATLERHKPPHSVSPLIGLGPSSEGLWSNSHLSANRNGPFPRWTFPIGSKSLAPTERRPCRDNREIHTVKSRCRTKIAWLCSWVCATCKTPPPSFIIQMTSLRLTSSWSWTLT